MALLTVLCVILLGIIWTLYRSNKIILSNLNDMEKNYITLQSSKKSAETRLGQIAEKLAPMLEDFPVKGHDVHFLGQPIDYIAYNEDGIHFIEIKSGNADLSVKQRKIRDQIQAGKVFWHVMRIK